MPHIKALFPTSANAGTAASDATNGIWTNLKANLRSELSVNGSGHIEGRKSTSGSVVTSITAWGASGEIISNKYSVKLPDNSLTDNLTAIVAGLNALVDTPNGYDIQGEMEPDSLADPSLQINSAGWINDFDPAGHLALNYANRGRGPRENPDLGNWYVSDLQTAGHIDADGDVVSLPAGIVLDEPMFFLWDVYGSDETILSAYDQNLVVKWAGDNDAITLSGPAISMGAPSGSRFTATLDCSAGNGFLNYLKPASNVVIVPEDLEPLWDAGLKFNPDHLNMVKPFRIERHLDTVSLNTNMTGSDADMPPSDWRLWYGGGRFFSKAAPCYGVTAPNPRHPHVGPPVEAICEEANLTRKDPWFCIPFRIAFDDAECQAYLNRIRNTLDPDLVAYIECHNEIWNFAGDFYGYWMAKEEGHNLLLKAALAAGDSSSGYAVNDEVNDALSDIVVRILAVDGGGSPTSMKVVYKRNAPNLSNVSMNGGSGSGLVLDFTEYVVDGFPTIETYGYAVMVMANAASAVWGGDFLTKVRPIIGGQQSTPGIWSAIKNGMNWWLQGIAAGHPDSPTPGNDPIGNYSDYFYAGAIANYCASMKPGAETTLQSWAQAGTYSANMKDEIINGTIAGNDGAATAFSDLQPLYDAWRSNFSGDGITRMFGYEGGTHADNLFPSNTDIDGANRNFHELSGGMNDVLNSFYTQFEGNYELFSNFGVYKAYYNSFCWTAAKNWTDINGPMYQSILAENQRRKGSAVFDTGRADFGAGYYIGCLKHNSYEGKTDAVSFGYRNDIILGDGTNVAVMPNQGFCGNREIVFLPGVKADYTVTTNANGGKTCKRTSDVVGFNFDPATVITVHFAGDGSTQTVSTWV